MAQVKKTVKIETVQKKKRISASVAEWMTEETYEWAKKEERSFSNMLERLLWEALQTRKGLNNNLKTKK